MNYMKGPVQEWYDYIPFIGDSKRIDRVNKFWRFEAPDNPKIREQIPLGISQAFIAYHAMVKGIIISGIILGAAHASGYLSNPINNFPDNTHGIERCLEKSIS